MLFYCDQKTLGTDGGTFTSGAWRVQGLKYNDLQIQMQQTLLLLPTSLHCNSGNYWIQWQSVAELHQRYECTPKRAMHDASSSAHMGNTMLNWTCNRLNSCTILARVAMLMRIGIDNYSIRWQYNLITATGFGYADHSAVEIYTVR